jgi:hypothetical protein
MLARVLAFVAFMISASRVGTPQAPVPTVQPQATSTLKGSVSDSTGTLVRHATITATDQYTGASVYTEVSGSGKFSVRVPPGDYKLTVKADGLSELTREVRVTPGTSENLDLVLGGPVPVVQPHPSLGPEHVAGNSGSSPNPHNAPKDVTVQSCTASTKAEVLDCITTSADGHRLLGVVGGEPGTAYFIWLRDPAAHFSDIRISDPLALSSPAAVRDAYNKDIPTFCGSMKLSAGYLLFYR